MGAFWGAFVGWAVGRMCDYMANPKTVYGAFGGGGGGGFCLYHHHVNLIPNLYSILVHLTR